MGDQAAYIGPIGAGTIAKLVHNCTSAVMGVALAEVFTNGDQGRGGLKGAYAQRLQPLITDT
jgi:3-hydroxyisobutyrate dehydrogenase-like beta-hydroxyacid dehydrogenase